MILTVIYLNLLANSPKEIINMENNTYQSMEHHQNERELNRYNQPAEPKRTLDTGRRPTPKPASHETPKGNGVKWWHWLLGGLAIFGGLGGLYEVFTNKSRSVTGIPPAVQRDTKQEQAQEIFRSLEKDFGEFVKAGAIEDFDYVTGERDLLSWRGKNIYPLKAGFIDVEKLTGAFTDALQPDTLEINHNRTKFQADIAGTSGFSAKSIIESSASDVNSLKPENANYISTRDLPGRIYDRIKYSGSQDSYGYIRFFLKTDNSNVLIMAAFSIDPYAALQPKSYIVLSSDFIPYDSRTLREIEDRINVRDDINAVEFTMKSGNVESNDDLTECLRKFINSFAK